ncbi:hypothetical protein J437_LFUL018329 [Ladona fulva]|uniref:Transposable element P transposase-like RNase H domain-containing protein n=1 Tax=Ladona fulva TaxID=123851 RepID=A0A8K0KP29_LADFU|nr:hypothetical protein J437_LFUL018329 [Ladona fulva]
MTSTHSKFRVSTLSSPTSPRAARAESGSESETETNQACPSGENRPITLSVTDFECIVQLAAQAAVLAIRGTGTQQSPRAPPTASTLQPTHCAAPAPFDPAAFAGLRPPAGPGMELPTQDKLPKVKHIPTVADPINVSEIYPYDYQCAWANSVVQEGAYLPKPKSAPMVYQKTPESEVMQKLIDTMFQSEVISPGKCLCAHRCFAVAKENAKARRLIPGALPTIPPSFDSSHIPSSTSISHSSCTSTTVDAAEHLQPSYKPSVTPSSSSSPPCIPLIPSPQHFPIHLQDIDTSMATPLCLSPPSTENPSPENASQSVNPQTPSFVHSAPGPSSSAALASSNADGRRDATCLLERSRAGTSILRDLGITAINPGVLKHLSFRVSQMPKLDKHSVLLFDEMSIKPSFALNSRSDCIDGFEDHGSIGRSTNVAREALFFMVRGLRQKWKQPVVSYFSHKATSGAILADLIREVLGALQSTGLKIAATVCDMGSNNILALRILGSTLRMAPMETNVTTSFLCFIHDLFQSLNGVKSEGDRVGLKSYVREGSPHLEFWGRAAQELKDWEFMKEGRKIKPRSWNGIEWAITIEAAKQLWVKLKEAGFSYLEPRRLN